MPTVCVQILLIAHTVCTNSLNSTQCVCVCVCINSLKNTQPDLIGSDDIAAAAVTAFLDHIISEAVCN